MDKSKKMSKDIVIHKICFFSCLVFLAAHIIYLTFFLIVQVKPMIYINIASVTFYTLLLFVVMKRIYFVYVYAAAFEISAFMTLGTIICGIDSGFHLCLIALTILAFFAGYFSKSGEKHVKPIFLSVVFMLLFIFAYIWLKFNNPISDVNSTISTILFFTHIGIVFGFGITFLAILTSYTVLLEKRIEKQSTTDRLTNIPNRNGLNDYFVRIGESKDNYVIAIFDIDNFKKFNDRNGHLCGDYVLKEIARIASENSKDDFVSRWGGEEFVVIAKIDESIEKTISKIDRIRETIENYEFNYDNKKLKSTVTIGVAEYDNYASIDDWIKTADEKLYQGKHNGKNKTVS